MTKLDEFKQKIKGKTITVIGLGVSNLPLIEYLVKLGAGEIHACDKRSYEKLGETASHLENLGIKLHLGEDYLEHLYGEIVFRTPGLRYDVPALNKARERGAYVTSEMEVFCQICPSHIIAVTGSDGKTTTTTLIHKMLTDAGYTTWLGGNIGNPLLSETEKMSPDDWVVLELSSFQLHTMETSPEIAVVTNLSPNHLDYHKDYQEYIDAKKNIFLHQDKTGTVILNTDNGDSIPLVSEAMGTVKRFSRKSRTEVYLDGNIIKRGETAVLDISDIKIPGMHNVENYMAAIAAVEGLVNDDVIVKTAKEFGGVEHRIELVRTLDGVKYYNSSIDSSPNRTINTLKVFQKKVIMIAGGKDKGIPYDEIGPAIAESVKTLILIGATSENIEKALNAEIERTGNGADVDIIHASTYQEAVTAAKSAAREGDIVLLSPASTSFDMFNNFMERGNLFKQLVNEL